MTEERPIGRRAQESARERIILRAAIEELASSDYGGMTIEGVAARAGVNKTTVYRKWDTKAALIRAALDSVLQTFRVGPTAGDLRSDLLRIAHNVLDFTRSLEGQSLLRLRLLQHPEPALAKIAKDLNERQLNELAALISAAVERGEISPDIDGILLLDMLWGAIHTRVIMKNERVDGALLTRIVELLLKAAGVPSPAKSAPAKSRRKRTR
jgi:AcrR family transcriptional regulator